MIPNLRPNTTYAVHLRAASASGGKDWVGSVTGSGEIHTYWGKTGQINQHAAKPGGLPELHKIVNQKQNGKDQYTQVDLYTPQQGWLSQRPPTVKPQPVPPPAATAVPLANWNVEEAPDDSIKWDF